MENQESTALSSERSRYRYPAHRALKSFAVGFFTCSLGSLLTFWLTQQNIHGRLAFIDNVVMGAAAGIIVVYHDEQRHRELDRRLKAVRLMNHHVRNAMQIVCSASATESQMVRNAVDRIEWALREVLPGAVGIHSTDDWAEKASQRAAR